MKTKSEILVADIGGTNARFALSCMAGDEITLREIMILKTCDYDSLQSAISAYLTKTNCTYPQRASIAIAAPIINDAVKMTNNHWSFSIKNLAQELKMEEVIVINDFEAMACSLPFLDPDELLQIGGGHQKEGGNKLVIGPGTGTGIAALTPINDDWKVLTSEGGHIAFAPVNELERQLLEVIREKHSRVSVERILSGAGLSALYQAFMSLKGEKSDLLCPSEITRQAVKDPASDYGQIAHVFCNILGSYAGDMALTFNAVGGVYLTGGIMPNIQGILLSSNFRMRFEDKGRLSYIKEIPTLKVTEKQPALIGAAARLFKKFY